MIEEIAYLEAKRGLDDRSLDRTVVHEAFGHFRDEPRIFEIGAGTLSMPERLVDWGILQSGRWIAVDLNEAAIAHGRNRLLDRPDGRRTDTGIAISDLEIETREADAFECVDHVGTCDLLVGNAVFDLIDLNRVSAFAGITDRVYAPITYNGHTSFEPALEDDGRILTAYRKHMASCRSGSPTAADELESSLATVEATGDSSWEISPPYQPEEITVLTSILSTIDSAVSEIGVDANDWYNRRQEQLRNGELHFIARNRDILGRL